jgi:hypothetical protein
MFRRNVPKYPATWPLFPEDSNLRSLFLHACRTDTQECESAIAVTFCRLEPHFITFASLTVGRECLSEHGIQ